VCWYVTDRNGGVMKIVRAPKSADKTYCKIHEVDERKIGEESASWYPNYTYWFDGTIDKSGGRKTDIGVELNEDDVIALHGNLMDYYRRKALKCDEYREEIDALKEVLNKIWKLVLFHQGMAPDEQSLLSAIGEIANHFSWNDVDPFESKFSWLHWNDL
jgi:hypothetical protein